MVKTALLCLALAVAPSGSLSVQETPSDAEVVKGMKQLDDGDYDGAILTLDNAVRRLAADRSRATEVSQAYLYLGIAYLGKGADAAARAKFRQAIGLIRDLTLSPEKFPPKVVNLFEEARDEVARAGAVPPPTAPRPGGAAANTPKKGGSKTILLVVGGVAVAGGAVALAAGGGGGTESAAGDTRRTLTFNGLVGNTGDISSQNWRVDATASGTLEARVTWVEPNVLVVLSLSTATSTLVDSGQTGQNESALTSPVTAQSYTISVRFSATSTGPRATYTLTVRTP